IGKPMARATKIPVAAESLTGGFLAAIGILGTGAILVLLVPKGISGTSLGLVCLCLVLGVFSTVCGCLSFPLCRSDYARLGWYPRLTLASGLLATCCFCLSGAGIVAVMFDWVLCDQSIRELGKDCGFPFILLGSFLLFELVFSLVHMAAQLAVLFRIVKHSACPGEAGAGQEADKEEDGKEDDGADLDQDEGEADEACSEAGSS
ncbi:hypothetical protein BOX15_Mlig033583g2, partial [Macrostomum lignano]